MKKAMKWIHRYSPMSSLKSDFSEAEMRQFSLSMLFTYAELPVTPAIIRTLVYRFPYLPAVVTLLAVKTVLWIRGAGSHHEPD
ncbi:MAG: hypothetical protein ISR91_02250 [Candidatus Delongbacteria bacterium]|nr:hypothetical protein [Candidatus Delongbacteria bacterium]